MSSEEIDWSALEAELTSRALGARTSEDDLPPMSEADLFFRDLLAECIATGLARQWRERAQQFLSARPLLTDYPGQETTEQRRARWHRLTATAKRCEAKAALIEGMSIAEILAQLSTKPAPVPVMCSTCGTCTSPWTCSCGETRAGEAA